MQLPEQNSETNATQALAPQKGAGGTKKKKFALKWFFGLPFTSGNKSKPTVEDISSLQSNPSTPFSREEDSGFQLQHQAPQSKPEISPCELHTCSVGFVMSASQCCPCGAAWYCIITA